MVPLVTFPATPSHRRGVSPVVADEPSRLQTTRACTAPTAKGW